MAAAAVAESRARLAAGFSLIEILAVVVIIAIGTGVVLVSLGSLGGRSDQAQTAVKLAGLIELASENARMENLQYGLKIKPHHYEFVVFDGKGNWLPLTDKPVLGGHDLPAGMKLEVSTDQEIIIPVIATAPGAMSASGGVNAPAASTRMKPQIAILSTGEITPFTLRLTAPNDKIYLIRNSGNGRVHVVPPASVNGPQAVRYQN